MRLKEAPVIHVICSLCEGRGVMPSLSRGEQWMDCPRCKGERYVHKWCEDGDRSRSANTEAT